MDPEEPLEIHFENIIIMLLYLPVSFLAPEIGYTMKLRKYAQTLGYDITNTILNKYKLEFPYKISIIKDEINLT